MQSKPSKKRLSMFWLPYLNETMNILEAIVLVSLTNLMLAFAGCKHESQMNQVAVHTSSSAQGVNQSQQANLMSQEMKTSQTSAPQNILDYYLLLPSEYISGVIQANKDLRAANIKVKDVPNGYIYIESPSNLSAQEEKERAEELKREGLPPEGTPNLTLALFKKTNGDAIIAAASERYDGSPFLYKHMIKFLEYNGEWKDITEQVLASLDSQAAFEAYVKQGKPGDKDNPRDTPERLRKNFYFKLPRYGKTIKVIIDPQWSTSSQVELLNMIWQGDNFKIEPAV